MTEVGFTVLVVGDVRGLAERLVAELDVGDASVLTVPDGKRARETLHTTPVDCVVCAQPLPQGRGDSLLRWTREFLPDLPFVLVGDRIERSVAATAIDADVTDYVTKDPREGQVQVLARRIESAARDRQVTDRTEREMLTLRSALSELPVVVSVCDGSGTIRFVEGLGFDAVEGLDDATGESLEEVFDGYPDLLAACNRALDGEQVEYLFEVEDRVFETVHSPIREGGRVVGATMAAMDVTDRVERDRELTETRTVLRKSFEYARDAIMIIDPENDAIRRVNPAACELLGYDREELLATSPEAIHPDEVETFRAFVGSVLDEGEGWTDDLTCLTSDGTALPAEISASAIRLDGRPHVLAIIRDVTDRKVYEHRLEALNELGRELMTVDDAETIAERVVAVAERVLDHPLTAVWAYDPVDECLEPLDATEPAAEFSESDDDPERLAAIPEGAFEMRVFREGEPREVEDYAAVSDAAHPETPLGTVLMVPMGDHGVLHVGSPEVTPFEDSDRHLVEILARVAEGAFDRVERVRELERRNERLEEFASVVSHDLRNPLEIAEGYLEQARRTGNEEYFDEMEAALDHMEQLIDDVLTLARQGETVSEFEVVDLETIAEDAWSIAGDSGARLEVDPDLGRIACDPDRLRQLLENLFANSVAHGGPDPTVVVGGIPGGFYVADDGPGIPPEDRETVFESGETDDPNGTGFGLAIVRRIAEAHDWSVHATESEDVGARFEVNGVDRT